MSTNYYRVARVVSLFAACTALLNSGCYSTSDLARDGHVQVQAVDTRSLDIGIPSVRQDGSDLVVSGMIRKYPQTAGPTMGHLHVELINPTGEVIQWAVAEWSPPALHASRPGRGGNGGHYYVRVPWTIPRDVMIRVSVGKDSHE